MRLLNRYNLKMTNPSLRREFSSSENVFLFLVWLISGLILSLPIAEEFSLQQKLIFLIPIIFLSTFLVLLKHAEGLAVWSLGITFLVVQTGFQADVGGIRTSALEIVILLLLIIILFIRQRSFLLDRISFKFPGRRAYLGFAFLSIVIFLVGVIRGDSLTLAFWEFKGFLLYPLMGFVMLACVRSETLLKYSIYLAGGWYVIVAARGVWEFSQGQAQLEQVTVAEDVFRAGGDYAPQNLFGITLIAMALLILGIAIDSSRRTRFLGLAVSAWLVFGALTSVSRTSVLGLGVGIIFLFLTQRTKKGVVLGMLVAVGVFLLLLLPPPVYERIFQLTDSSTTKRLFYLESGWQALKTFWIMGAGWGNGYYYERLNGLVATGEIPWYHNDYLNLAVQVGVFGLIFYIAFWGSVLRESYRSLKVHCRMARYVRGFLTALVSLLASAFFEHVLWRTDIGGFVGWTFGMLMVSVQLLKQEQTIFASERNDYFYR